MKRSLQIVFAVLMIASVDVVGQDIHFSQYYASPLTLNPALTGVFNGSFRFAANYRNQWRTVTPNTYSTISGSADMSFLKRGIGRDYVGMGLVFLSDRAGDGNMGTTNVGFSMSYNKALSRKSKQYLSFGFQFGFSQRKIDYEFLVFNSQFDGTTIGDFGSSREPLTKTRYYNWDNSIGLMWYIAASEKINVYTGFAMAHVNGPNQSFFIEGDVPLYMKYTVNAGMEINTTDHFQILPKLLYQRQGPSQEINIGSTMRIIPNPHKHGAINSFYGGALYRFSNFNSHDAVIIVVGGEYKRLNFGLTIDLNVSRLIEASYALGGPELSIMYTLPDLKHGGSNQARYCPDAISF